MFDPYTILTRRSILKTLAAFTVTPPLLGFSRGKDGKELQAAPRPSLGIIVVTDDSIPTELMHRQHDVFLSAVCNTRSLHGSGIGNKAYAAADAMTCDAWIAEMRREAGVEKVVVLVWTRRYGPMLTVPLMTKADILVVRTYARPTIQRPTTSRAVTIDSIVSYIDDLAARMRRNGRPFLVRLEADSNLQPLGLEDIPPPGDGIPGYAND